MKFWLLKTIVFYIFVSLATIIFGVISPLCIVLSDNMRYKIITLWSKFFIFWAKICYQLNYCISGIENIPTKPFVIIANHQSIWETIITQVILPPQSWVLKKELLLIPFFGWGLALLQPIAIHRHDRFSVKTILKQGKMRLSNGRCVLIYPEGTRVAIDEKRRYSRTGAALAVEANVPLIPMAHNAGYFWPRGLLVKSSGTIQIHFGKQIDLSSNDVKHITQQAQLWIETTKAGLK